MWVWDSSQQVLATQGAVYVQGHCLQEQRLYKRLHCLQALGPLQEHTTFRESLVCYTLCRRCCENAVAAGEGKGI